MLWHGVHAQDVRILRGRAVEDAGEGSVLASVVASANVTFAGAGNQTRINGLGTSDNPTDVTYFNSGDPRCLSFKLPLSQVRIFYTVYFRRNPRCPMLK